MIILLPHALMADMKMACESDFSRSLRIGSHGKTPRRRKTARNSDISRSLSIISRLSLSTIFSLIIILAAVTHRELNKLINLIIQSDFHALFRQTSEIGRKFKLFLTMFHRSHQSERMPTSTALNLCDQIKYEDCIDGKAL